MRRNQIFKFKKSQILKFLNSSHSKFHDQNFYLSQQVDQWISCRIQASAIYLLKDWKFYPNVLDRLLILLILWMHVSTRCI